MNFFLTHLNYSSPIAELAIYISVILVLSFLINFLLLRSIIGRGYRLFVAPGVILHELSHALFCMLTFAEIKKISFFDKSGGSVTHAKSKLPIFGNVLISLAPFAIGAIAIFFLSKCIGLSKTDIFTNIDFKSVLNSIVNTLKSIDFSSIWNWVIFYLIVSIAVTMTPSVQDFKNVAFALIFIGALIYLLVRFTHLLDRFAHYGYDKILILLASVIVILVLALIFSLVLYGISKLLGH